MEGSRSGRRSVGSLQGLDPQRPSGRDWPPVRLCHGDTGRTRPFAATSQGIRSNDQGRVEDHPRTRRPHPIAPGQRCASDVLPPSASVTLWVLRKTDERRVVSNNRSHL
jgi:hypothetical protein